MRGGKPSRPSVNTMPPMHCQQMDTTSCCLLTRQPTRIFYAQEKSEERELVHQYESNIEQCEDQER